MQVLLVIVVAHLVGRVRGCGEEGTVCLEREIIWMFKTEIRRPVDAAFLIRVLLRCVIKSTFKL
jgi:hypothetical protein